MFDFNFNGKDDAFDSFIGNKMVFEEKEGNLEIDGCDNENENGEDDDKDGLDENDENDDDDEDF